MFQTRDDLARRISEHLRLDFRQVFNSLCEPEVYVLFDTYASVTKELLDTKLYKAVWDDVVGGGYPF